MGCTQKDYYFCSMHYHSTRDTDGVTSTTYVAIMMMFVVKSCLSPSRVSGILWWKMNRKIVCRVEYRRVSRKTISAACLSADLSSLCRRYYLVSADFPLDSFSVPKVKD